MAQAFARWTTPSDSNFISCLYGSFPRDADVHAKLSPLWAPARAEVLSTKGSSSRTKRPEQRAQGHINGSPFGKDLDQTNYFKFI